MHKLIHDHGFTIANLSSRLTEGGQQFEYRMTIKSRNRKNAEALSVHLRGFPRVVEFRIAPYGRLAAIINLRPNETGTQFTRQGSICGTSQPKYHRASGAMKEGVRSLGLVSSFGVNLSRSITGVVRRIPVGRQR